MLTAEQGADRWNERNKGQKPQPRSDNTPPLYRCENCGASTFRVDYEFSRSRTVRQILDCSCGEFETACLREILETEGIGKQYELGIDHCPLDEELCEADIIYEPIVQFEDKETLEFAVTCNTCYAAADPHDWEYEVDDDWEKSDESWEIRCNTCEHEVEYGWSHGPGTRIWRVESSDFNPWACVVEAKFADAWERRGWIPPRRS